MSNRVLQMAQTAFLEMHLGMFIHFGLYSQGKEHEWHMFNHKMDLKTYKKKFLTKFNPDPRGIDQWVHTAKAMGAKYLICTSKHCDGFCLWDTKYPHELDPDYHIRNTIFWNTHQKSVLDYLMEAGKKYGIKIGFYHSVVDWSWSEKRWLKAPGHWIRNEKLNAKYIINLKERLSELLTVYPDTFALWLDAYPLIPNGYQRLKYSKLYEHLHQVKPNILIGTNKAMTQFKESHLDVPEDFIIMENMAHKSEFNPIPVSRPEKLKGIPAEVCITVNDHWGYNERDKKYKDIAKMAEFIRNNIKNGGNTLLNFGPKPDGYIAEDQVELAKKLGTLLN
jgi:alpha-L-fucosidase